MGTTQTRRPRTKRRAGAATPDADMDAALRLRSLEAENARLRRTLAGLAPLADRLSAAQHQLHEILECSLQAVLIHRGGPPLYVNPPFQRMLGFRSRQEALAIGDPATLVHPEDRGLVRSHIAARITGREAAAHYEFRALRQDGTTIWLECLASRILWEGQPAAFATLHDITARKQAEAALRRSEKQFATVFHASPDMISLTTLEDGRYVDVNDSFLRMLGRTREELIGRTAQEVNRWSDPGFRERMVEQLRRDRVMRDVEARVHTGSGELRDVSYSIEVIRVDDRDLLLAVGRDITEQRRHDRELQHSKEAAELANRSKSEFLANMSHELRTPLNAIIGFSEVIRDQMFGPTGNPRYAEYAHDIHASGQHLLQIINDLLDLSKLEAGKLDLHETEIALPGLVEDCLRLVRERAQAAEVSLAMAVPGDLPGLRADARILKQILLNLLTNSIKFTPRGGKVRIDAARLPCGALAIDVADTGIGMSAADIAVALTPFGQVDGSFARKHQGTGLGLPLARSLAELHGGRLAVASTPGAGTTVTVTLPAARVLRRATAALPA